MYKKFFITGYPGSGKTTIFNDIVTKLKKNLSELSIYGFITKEVRRKGIRVGFSIENFHDEKGILSHIDYKNGPRVGKYGVDLQDLEKVGINTLLNALRKPKAKIIAIDEIGKMELFHPEFLKILDRIIASDKIMIATISYKMTELLTKFKNRRDTCVFNLENAPKDSIEREELKEKILKIILKNYIPQK
jgi:nucleoside-triphosphatase